MSTLARHLRPSPRALGALLALGALFGLVAGPARGERTQRGHLIVAFSGNFDPLRLPRDHNAPIALRIGGRIGTDDGSPLPRLTQISLRIDGRGALDATGLPVCPRARLRNADSAQALRACGSALVGRGTIGAQVFLPHQASFPLASRLLAFNGRTRNGTTAIWVHAFSVNPPLSIVLPFVVHRRGRRLSTVLTATVPRSLGNLPHLSGFEITLARRFRDHGRPRSYLSASCPIPPALSAGFLAFANATYSFADGRRLRVEAVRSCRAR